MRILTRVDLPVLSLAVAQTILWAGLYYVFPALLLRWEAELGWSRTWLTGAFTSAILASALAAPLVGRQIDRGRGPQVMALSATLAAGLLASLALVTSLWQFYACWVLIGALLAGCLYEPCFALITRARDTEAKSAIIKVTLIAGFAGTISFPSAHQLAQNFGWRTTVMIFAAVVMVIGGPLQWFGARAVEQRRLNTKEPSQPPSCDAPAVVAPIVTPEQQSRYKIHFLALSFALLAVVHGATLHHVIPILREWGVAANLAVLAVACVGPMQVAGRIVISLLAARVSNRTVAYSCYVALSVAVLLLYFAQWQSTFVIGFVVLFGASYGVVSIIRPVIARDVLGQENFGEKSGSLARYYLVGAAISPWLGSLIWAIGGYALLLCCLVILGFCGLLIFRRVVGVSAVHD